VPAVYRTEINDVLLLSLLVDLEGTGSNRKRYRFIADNRLVYNYLPSAALEGFPARGGTEGH